MGFSMSSLRMGRGPLVLVVGPKREGKSSIVNMLAGRDIALTASDILPSHGPYQMHSIRWDDTFFGVCDTLGLDYNESPSIQEIKDLTRYLGGVGLVVYCMSARRLRKDDAKHVGSIYNAFCRADVPLVLVITRLEGEKDMQSWWTKNEAEFASSIPG
ncbi:hypothetical protein HYDPIDRAFT_147707, partial [Hydnomerulius pinastri MD-312]